MHIARLNISQLRNLISLSFEPQPGFNIIWGENGSGKTSLLEAIYILGMGRSFRTHLLHRVITHGKDSFTLFTKLIEDSQPVTIGFEALRQGKNRIHINSELIGFSAALAKQLPLQLISPSSYRLLENGPQFRRQFLDWGVFHVKQSFYHLWKRHQQILKQRNAALKTGASNQEISAWDEEFIETSEALDDLRGDYLKDFQPIVEKMLKLFLPQSTLKLSYYRGWSRENSLVSTLSRQLPRDRELGYTQSGSQRADLKLLANGQPAHEILSRGQQKLLVCALHLAQGKLLKVLNQQDCIYLVDDLPSELDITRCEKVIEVLKSLESQIFISSVEPEPLSELVGVGKMFHVEHLGVIDEIGENL